MPRYALVVGISEYTSPLSKLSKPAIDAETIAGLLRKYGDFAEVNLLTGRVTCDDLRQAIVRLGNQASGAEALIYFTGHGVPVFDPLNYANVYLATSDCVVRVNQGKANHIESGLALSSLNKFIQNAGLSSLVVLLDCCHSGCLIENSWITSALTSMNQANYHLLAACREFEQAWAKRSQNHSVFTGALVRGLSREKAGADGRISCDALFASVKDELKDCGQEPISLTLGGSTTLIRYSLEVQEVENELLLRQKNSASIPEVSRDTRIMEIKMKAGQISDEEIDHIKDCVASAEHLGITWLRKHGAQPKKAAEQYEHLRMITRTECLEAYNTNKTSEQPFGDKMLRDAWGRLRQLHDQEKEQLFGCRFEHLLGVAGILTEECKVWWSDRFDIQENEEA